MSDVWPGTAEPAQEAWPGQQQDTMPKVPVSGAPDGYQPDPAIINSTSVGSIMRAFGQGFGEGFGPEQLGLSKESTEWLAKTGIFASGSKFGNPFQAFNEGIIANAATALDGAIRTANATYRGLQSAGVEAGLPRDIVSLPDAFMGSPGSLGEIKMRPGLGNDAREGIPVEKPPAEEATQPKPPAIVQELGQAQDLGIIGPEKPSIVDPDAGTPKDIAERAVPAAQTPGEKVTQEVGNPARDKAGNIRLDQIGINADAHDVIIKAAETNDDFNNARQGDVPLAQIESLSDATGIPSATLTANDGLGRLMHNDAVVRTWLQAFHQASDEIAAKMAEVALNATDQGIEELREMKLRFQHMQEQVSGLTAEAGRTLGVFREFYEAKGKAEALGKVLEENPGNDAASIKKLADAGKELDRASLPKFLADARKPGAMDKLFWYWQNNLISGWLTHTKYAAANLTYAMFERGVVTPMSAVVGSARAALGIADADRAFMGEAFAGMAGYVAATPMALLTAIKSVKTGMKVMTAGEAGLTAVLEAAGEKVPKSLAQRNPLTQTSGRPIGGKLGRAIGIPGDAANAIHTFFNIAGDHAEAVAQAYRATIKEGISVFDSRFGDRTAYWLQNPTREMLEARVEAAHRGTFIDESGPRAKAFQKWIRDTPGARWVFPFNHIPLNIAKRSAEVTPFAPLSSEVRADLSGANGPVAQARASSRMVAGAAFGGWAVYQTLNGRMTGDYPTDVKERDNWKLTGKQPNSIMIGNNWVSFDKFGPIGDVMRLSANIGQVVPHIGDWWKGEDDEGMTKATVAIAKAAGNTMVDQVGFLSVKNILEAYQDEKKGTAWVANTAGSFAPGGSFMSQTASFLDPEMREAKTFIDGLRYRVPGVRENLLPKRDWSGQPIPNPQFHSILRTRAVNTDPVDLELANLGIHPTPPQGRIAGVKLTPEQYDRYQATAGVLTRSVLNSFVNSEGWYNSPPYQREKLIRDMIEKTRKQAAVPIQMENNALLVRQALQDRKDKIEGVKPTKLKDVTQP